MMCTVKQSNNSSGFLLASVFIDDELSCIWYMLFNANLVEVEVFSKHYRNLFLFELNGWNELFITVEVFLEIKIESLFNLIDVHFNQFITLK